MTNPTTQERIRLTITVTPEVHAAFTRLAGATNASLGRAMGDWLGDTLEAAEHAATLMERARAAPKQVMREIHAYALGVADEAGVVVESFRKRGIEDRAAGGVVPPRPVIRGGKSPKAGSGGKARG